MDTSTYCYEKYFLHRDLDSAYVFRHPILDVVPSPNSSATSAFDNFLNSIFGFDVLETIVEFFVNTNTDRTEGTVGLIYFVTNFFSLQQCRRENLVCVNGTGLEIGLLVALGITILVVIVFAAILPPASQLSTFVIALAYPSAFLFFASVTMQVAWDWKPSCLSNPEAPLTSFLLPFLVSIPLLPECMAQEALRVVNTYFFNPCAFQSLTFGVFNGLIAGGQYACNDTTTCAAGPLDFVSCYDRGFTSSLQTVGVLLLKTVPSFALYLKSTCLVRGGCLDFIQGSGSDSNTFSSTSGILGSLFSGYSVQAVIAGTDPAIKSCVFFVLTVDIFSLIFVISTAAVAVFFLFWAVALSIEMIKWGVALVSAPPISYLFTKDPEDTYYGSSGQSVELLFDV